MAKQCRKGNRELLETSARHPEVAALLARPSKGDGPGRASFEARIAVRRTASLCSPHSRPKDGVASLAYGSHLQRQRRRRCAGMTEIGVTGAGRITSAPA